VPVEIDVFPLNPRGSLADRAFRGKEIPLKNKTFLLFVLTLGFVGATSCGDDKDSGKDLEIQALRAALQQQGSQGPVTQTVTQTQTKTNTVTQTATATSTSTATRE
jgi:hypothetical protein